MGIANLGQFIRNQIKYTITVDRTNLEQKWKDTFKPIEKKDTIILSVLDILTYIEKTQKPQMLEELHKSGWKIIFFVHSDRCVFELLEELHRIEKHIPFVNNWAMQTINPAVLETMSEASFAIIDEKRIIDFPITRYTPEVN